MRFNRLFPIHLSSIVTLFFWMKWKVGSLAFFSANLPRSAGYRILDLARMFLYGRHDVRRRPYYIICHQHTFQENEVLPRGLESYLIHTRSSTAVITDLAHVNRRHSRDFSNINGIGDARILMRLISCKKGASFWIWRLPWIQSLRSVNWLNDSSIVWAEYHTRITQNFQKT